MGATYPLPLKDISIMDKPFSKAFVMRTTFRHMRRSVDISIRKSFERFQALYY